jgi:hypothetical protein
MPGPAEVFRATQAQNAKQSVEAEGATVVAERGRSPGEMLLESDNSHTREIGGKAIQLDQVATEPQAVPVHIVEVPAGADKPDSVLFPVFEAPSVETKFDSPIDAPESVFVIPEEVVAAVAAIDAKPEDVGKNARYKY